MYQQNLILKWESKRLRIGSNMLRTTKRIHTVRFQLVLQSFDNLKSIILMRE